MTCAQPWPDEVDVCLHRLKTGWKFSFRGVIVSVNKCMCENVLILQWWSNFYFHAVLCRIYRKRSVHFESLSWPVWPTQLEQKRFHSCSTRSNLSPRNGRTWRKLPIEWERTYVLYFGLFGGRGDGIGREGRIVYRVLICTRGLINNNWVWNLAKLTCSLQR